MNQKKHIIYCFLLLLFACQNPSKEQEKKQDLTPPITGQAVVDSAIARYGMSTLSQAKISLDFRDKHYEAIRNHGHYDYYRIFTDKEGQKINDHLFNEGFVRTINGDTATVSSERASAYSQSVNSVIYFALLPYFLNDGAVYKEYLGLVNIKGKSYHKVKVTFSEEGGGEDSDDVFLYWFEADSYQMNYLAYKYHTEGGGIRLREAYNIRKVNGVQIADYINWKAPFDSDFEQVEKAYEAGQLEELSKIALENVAID